MQDIRDTMVLGKGFSPVWTDSIIKLDLSQPVGCILNEHSLTIMSITGEQSVLGYRSLALPFSLPSGISVITKGELIYADLYFFQLSDLSAWISTTFISMKNFALDLFHLPVVPTVPTPTMYNLGNFYFVHCYTNISYYGHTSLEDINNTSHNGCKLVRNTMNIMTDNGTIYTSFDIYLQDSQISTNCNPSSITRTTHHKI